MGQNTPPPYPIPFLYTYITLQHATRNKHWEEAVTIEHLTTIKLASTEANPDLALFVSRNGIETDAYTIAILQNLRILRLDFFSHIL